MDCEFEEFKHLFPSETKIISFIGSADHYEAFLRSKCKNKEDFCQNWLKHYERIAKVALRVQQTKPRRGKTVVYKAAYRCQHNTYPKSHHQRVKTPHKKHTDCPAILRVTIKSSIENRRVRSNDVLRGEYPTLITIRHNHNHKCDSADENGADVSADSYSMLTFIENHILQEGIESIACNEEVITQPLITTQQDNQEQEEELNWSALGEQWILLFEKWQEKNSITLYNALEKATTYLENCKTETDAISALEFLGRSKSRKYGTEIAVQPVSVARKTVQCDSLTNFSLEDHTYNKEKSAQKEQLSHALQDCTGTNVLLVQHLL